MAQKSKLYLVDYDLPKGADCTRKFYQDVKSLGKGLSSKASKSVYVSEDLAAANTIHSLASRCGV